MVYTPKEKEIYLGFILIYDEGDVMIYKYYRSDSLHAICNFCKDQLFFNNIYEYEDKNEFEIVSDDVVIRKTSLDLSPLLKEKSVYYKSM